MKYLNDVQSLVWDLHKFKKNKVDHRAIYDLFIKHVSAGGNGTPAEAFEQFIDFAVETREVIEMKRNKQPTFWQAADDMFRGWRDVRDLLKDDEFRVKTGTLAVYWQQVQNCLIFRTELMEIVESFNSISEKIETGKPVCRDYIDGSSYYRQDSRKKDYGW